MKIQSCSRRGRLVAAMVALTLLIAGPQRWDRLNAADGDPNAQAEPIRITADELVTDSRQRTAVFNGRVTAVQGETKLTADQLTIIYKATSDAASDGTNNIERLEARGRVRIAFDNKLAVSNQAVYIIAERKLILEGPETKVSSDQNEIVGTRITFYRNDGRMVLESDPDNQVEALIHSGQRGLN